MKGTLSPTRSTFAWLNWPPVITFTVVFILFFVLSFLRLDPDFGWHLTAGDYFLHNGVPHTDIFTYTAANFPWVNHEWLSDIFVSLLNSFGGYPLLAALYAALWTLAFFIVGRRISGPLVLLGVIAVLPFAGVRAVTWTVLGVAILYVIVKLKNQRLWFLIPLLFLLWANVHGGFAIGLVLLGYWAIAKRSPRLLLVLIASFAVTFINPYGIELYVEIFRTMLDGSLRFVITEWAPIGTLWQVVGYVAIWGAGFIVLRGKKWKSYLQLDVLLFIAALSSIRHYPLFVLLSLPFTDGYVTQLTSKIPHKLHLAQRRVLWAIVIIIASIAAWGIYDIYSIPLDRETGYPRSAVTELQRRPCEGNLFNDYTAGGYLIWKLPGQKVYIDGRMPSWEGDGHKYMDDYLRIFTDKDFRRDQFKKHGITCVLVRSGEKPSELVVDLKNEGWRVRSEDSRLILLER